ncbi:MAG TPA: adenylate/guanylate cyclase domain-containing protein [Chitinophagaceae bacterium]|jgi:adenylate cyclase|nr:adenylate/guanylate cyclase domain-containing protein [Chitinophagaceae bacterium]
MHLNGRAKTTLFLLLFFKSILAFAEDPTIDSLKNVLSTTTDSIAKAQVLLQISQEYESSSLEDAITYANLAKELSLKLNYNEGLANSFWYVGKYYKKLGKYPETLGAYTNALDIFKKINDLKGQSLILNNLGSLYAEQGQETKALEYYFQGLTLAEKLKDTTRIVVTLGNIGNIYLNKVNTYDKALEYLLRALPLARELKNDYMIGTITVNMGEVYMNRNMDDSALIYFDQSLAAYGATADVCYTLNDIGKLYEKKQNYDSALAYHNRALKIATDLGVQEDIAGSLLGIAQTYYSQQKISASLSAYKKAEEIAKSLDSKFRLKDAYMGLAACYSALKDYNSAFKYQTLLLDIKDSIYNRESDQKLQRMDFTFQMDKKQSEINLLTKDKELQESNLRRQKIARNAVTGGLFLVFVIAIILFRGYRNKVKTNKILDQQKEQIENLVLNILPSEVAHELRIHGYAKPKYFDLVSVLFTDFKGFTKIADELSPHEVVTELNECFIAFDEIIGRYGLEKIKTIGDSYMCAGGIPTPTDDHTIKMVNAGLEIKEYIRKRNEIRLSMGLPPWELRIGIHVGPIVAGVVGRKKYAYDIWGSTVNIASRMESNGEAGSLNVSAAVYNHIKDQYQCTYRGKIYAKNIGEIDMYFVDKELPKEIPAYISKDEYPANVASS